MKRRLTAFAAILALVVSGLTLAVIQPAVAADARDFNAGNIISDDIFFDGSQLSSQQVQQVLNSKLGSCRSGYTCLKDFRQATPNRAAVSGRCAAYVGGNQSAADIIAQVGAVCGISQKAIIVLLEKEQSLVTDDWPSARQYRSAMGYGCPDTADCDAEYYGFFNQVYAAALQFKNYAGNPTRWNHIAGRVNTVRYNPDASCGSSQVFIQNQATAGLYNYTPYQPNASALANLYGSGDSCGAYGNRNFWRIFTDWFGPTTSKGAVAIDTVYQNSGGANGVLGTAVTGYNEISDNGGGIVRGYTGGAIAWSAPRGAFPLTGLIRTYYGTQGGVSGALGWPASNPNGIAVGTGGTVQSFQNGAVAVSAAGEFTIKGAIRTHFNELGGIGGSFGWPVSEEICASGTCRQEYQGGIIYNSAAYGSRSISGAILTAYRGAGGMGGVLGLPVTPPISIASNGGGVVQAFESGAIAFSVGGGAQLLTGDIRNAFNAAGGIAGMLGWPTGPQTCAPDGSCSQSFTGGGVIWSKAKGAFVIPTGIMGAYTAAGGSSGALGWPQTTPIPLAGGLVQAFDGGAIAWSQATGGFALQGAVRTYFNAQGGITGPLGWPTGKAACDTAGVCTQSFVGGTVVVQPDGSGVILKPEIATAYAQSGGATGVLGAPTGGSVPIGGASPGVVNAFVKGAIAWSSQTGAFLLVADIRAFYNTKGGVTGPLGWPTANQTCATDGSCSQPFQGGKILWSPTGGGVVQ
ncbi:LGFP repeat-containing protein [Plantibacter sp. Mn2098]|uniref:LGFP repeat-containing protein n=1 Tax=Plantibacter sp. Mn2098 TaxID=3395266 RepID=UPI003BDA4EF4